MADLAIPLNIVDDRAERAADAESYARNATRHVELARRLYALRSARTDVLPATLLGEPGWDMLLDLFISEADGRPLGVTALCIGSGVATATALRYVGLLEESGLLVRTRDRRDSRRTFVLLTDRGREAMMQVLDAWTNAFARS